ncbi:hypothetical protein D3C81_1420920 [compost metagenome]
MLADHLIDRARAAGQRNHRSGIHFRRGEAGNQRAFTVAEQDQLAETRVSLELLPPCHRVRRVGLHRQIALIRRRRQARRNTALVVTHTGDIVFGQHPRQALEAVVAPAVGVVSVAIRRTGARNNQDNRHRVVRFWQQQRTEKFAGAGIQSDRAL